MDTLSVVATTSKPFTRTYEACGQRIVVSEVVKYRKARRYRAFLSVYDASSGKLVAGGHTLLDNQLTHYYAPRFVLQVEVLRAIRMDIFDEFRDV